MERGSVVIVGLRGTWINSHRGTWTRNQRGTSWDVDQQSSWDFVEHGPGIIVGLRGMWTIINVGLDGIWENLLPIFYVGLRRIWIQYQRGTRWDSRTASTWDLMGFKDSINVGLRGIRGQHQHGASWDSKKKNQHWNFIRKTIQRRYQHWRFEDFTGRYCSSSLNLWNI